MRPNLSLTNIASTLALLGTSAVLIACGGGDKPAASPAGATDVTASPTKAAGQGSCSANGCGATAKAPDTTKPTDGVAGGTGANATPTTAATATATTAAPAAPPPVATGTAPKPAGTVTAATAPKPVAPVSPPKTGTGAKPTGQASCGAGTCGTDTKKK